MFFILFLKYYVKLIDKAVIGAENITLIIAPLYNPKNPYLFHIKLIPWIIFLYPNRGSFPKWDYALWTCILNLLNYRGVTITLEIDPAKPAKIKLKEKVGLSGS